MKKIRMALVCAVAVGLAAQAAEDGLVGLETWGGRKAHPALVNQVMAVKNDPNVVSLRGTWDFRALPSVNLRNIGSASVFTGRGRWWSEKCSYNGEPIPLRRVQVPGCWEAQLVDDKVTTGRPWFCRWDSSPLAIRGYHLGDGFYRREVTLPAGWKGRRVWLKTGWVNSAGWFWVNGKQVAMDWNCCATYKYEVTDLVKFGERNMVIVQVNNQMPSHRGCINSKHHWGGILRDIEFEATPGTFIDDAWVRGNFDNRCALVHVEIEGPQSGAPEPGMTVRADIEGQSSSRRVDAKGEVPLRIPLSGFRPWSPEHPNLYTARVELVSADGTVLQTRFERFGVRKLEISGRELFLNGRPLYLRGAGWHAIDPIEGYSLPDRETWRKRARQIRAAGFNIVRNHTEIKMPEFFEVCDEVGLMVEAELPYYGDVSSDGQRFDPLADVELLYRHYRRYPSFAIYSFGNEGGFGPYLSRRIYAETKARDHDRLVIGQDGTASPTMSNPLNYPGTSDFAGGPITVKPRGIHRPSLPYFYHEYINSSVKFDTRVADGFTGVWAAPISRQDRADFLARFGLGLEWGDRLQDGQNRMQKIYLKYGLEAARLDPFSCGYSYWSLQDACSPQGGTFIGQALWNPFWGEKRCGSTTADVAVFNSPACLLMTDGDDVQLYSPDSPSPAGMFLDSTITNLVRVSGDRIKVIFHFANYGDAPIADATLRWRLVAGGRTLAAGESPVGDLPLGGVRRIAEAQVTIPTIGKACPAVLEAEAGGVRNSWRYWLFPRRSPRNGTRIACETAFYDALAPRYPGLVKLTAAEPSHLASVDTVIVVWGGELEKTALAAGKRVVSIANQTGKPNVTLGWWYMTEQMGAALKSHPMVSLLPHEGLFEQLFFRIGKTGLAMPVAGFAEKDLVMVGEGGKGCYLYLAATRSAADASRSLIAGLDVLSDTPEGTALLDGAIGLE